MVVSVTVFAFHSPYFESLYACWAMCWQHHHPVWCRRGTDGPVAGACVTHNVTAEA